MEIEYYFTIVYKLNVGIILKRQEIPIENINESVVVYVCMPGFKMQMQVEYFPLDMFLFFMVGNTISLLSYSNCHNVLTNPSILKYFQLYAIYIYINNVF